MNVSTASVLTTVELVKCQICKKKMPKVLANGKPNPYLRCYTCNKNHYASRKDTFNRWMNDDFSQSKAL